MRKARRYLSGFCLFALTMLLGVLVADRLFPPPLHKADKLSPAALDRHGELLHAFTTKEGRWRFAVEAEAVDPVFIERLIAVEDKRFFRHAGVDPLAIMRAGFSSAKAGRIVSGASTITMQTARLLEPRPRTLLSKLIEAARALQIERRLSKDEILSLYLTLAPYGGNIEGVRAASLLYFGKEPSRLTDAEQALLIALPQAPEARRPDRHAAAARAARKAALEALQRRMLISMRHAREAMGDPLPLRRRPLPRIAYHASYRFADESAPTRTTLDAALQIRAEALAARHAGEFNDGATVALLIIENETRAVRAAVGSSGLDAEGGWNDLTRAVRSPGSTLKPLIYALAFDDGRLGPASIIDDMPRRFGDYTPENFDRTFRGQVRMREALQHSLNLPAVAALHSVGARRFAARVNAAGVTLKTPDRAQQEAGLALALGGAGVTAQDLGALYAGLAEGGVVKPLRWIEDQFETNAYRLFSENAADAIADILRNAPTIAGRAPAALSQKAPRVAFKTGTSYGYRDAWTAGFGGGHTIIAWVGRADGASRPGATGRKAAAPLLFDAFDLLSENAGAQAQPEPSPEMMDFAPVSSNAADGKPEIIFPRNGVELYLENQHRGFTLAARGGAGEYRWYVNGAPVEAASSRAIWRPARAGFFDIRVVDAAGRAHGSKVRVRTRERDRPGGAG
ncbi:MAG: penicillin-binding protein 1C [Pseudomonadota bacterium]